MDFVSDPYHANSAARYDANLDANSYLRDMIRLVPQWPRERFLELVPKHWAATRALIDSAQLDLKVGFIDVPALYATPQ